MPEAILPTSAPDGRVRAVTDAVQVGAGLIKEAAGIAVVRVGPVIPTLLATIETE